MDVKQYGPALFPTLKQVRRLLDEAESNENRQSDAVTEQPISTDKKF